MIQLGPAPTHGRKRSAFQRRNKLHLLKCHLQASASTSGHEASVRPQKVGVLGGGQLGRMLATAASTLGLHVVFLDAGEKPAAAPVAQHVHGSVLDHDAVSQFANDGNVDVLTVEVEHVNADALANANVPVHPSPWTISTLQDKARQKEYLASCGVPVPGYQMVTSREEVISAASSLGYPFMLKARFGAYDGRGNALVTSEAEIDTCIESLGGLDEGALYVEQGVDFVAEVAVMVARGRHGTEMRHYDPVQTFHRGSILQELHVPAPLQEEQVAECIRVARTAVSVLEGDGMYGVELFITSKGDVLLNEIAPRVHNSGHHTIEACATSQFEQHLRAVLGWPLGEASLVVGASAMRNVLGETDDAEGARIASTLMHNSLSVPLVSSHWYGKDGVRTGRKVGHLTAISSSISDATARLRALESGASTDDVDALLPVPDALGSSAQAEQATSAVGIIMGSESDLQTMAPAADALEQLGIQVEVTVVSAHRTPDRMAEYARSAAHRGLAAIIAGAGGAAHLPGMVAAQTSLPVIGVPVPLRMLDGMDSLLSIVQMPRGVPVATVAIGNAWNAGLLAARIVGSFDYRVRKRLSEQMEASSERVLETAHKLETQGWRQWL